MLLFTHPEILKCNHNGVIGRFAHRDGKLDVWKTSERGNENNGWLGLFNRDGGRSMTIELTTKDLGLNPDRRYLLQNAWTREVLPVVARHRFEIQADGVVFLRYQQDP